jgi:hypothetical protein
LKCLSVKQPWAHLIMTGEKDVENRSWATPHRGPLLIASTKHADPSALFKLELLGVKYPTDLVYGSVLGVVTVTDCAESSSRWATEGACHWHLANPQWFPEPFPVRGAMGLFDVTVPDWVRSQLADELLALVDHP